ncbi:MAG: MaoC family dehydratase N-terminal domain-containing protein [Acidimicrobiia bacterium]
MTVERFPIEAGHILLFARSVGDPNPVYQDPDLAVAPPTFVQASAQFDPDYFLRPRPGQPWMGSASTPSQLQTALAAAAAASGDDAGAGARGPGGGGGGGGGAGLHAEQHYEYHRVPRPGDVLSATVRPGESWVREGRRGGTLTFSESVTEYRDQHGELVVTARSVGVQTSQIPEAR